MTYLYKLRFSGFIENFVALSGWKTENFGDDIDVATHTLTKCLNYAFE